MVEHRERPVLVGLVALVSVAVVVGVVAGIAALGATRVLGLGGDRSSARPTAEASLYLPDALPTGSATEPQITLPGGNSPSGDSGTAQSEQSETPSQKPKKKISLRAGQTSVSPMGRVDLTGAFEGGEGAILQVQRGEGGSWSDFASVTASVSDGTFSTYIQTGQIGQNKFRVIDIESGQASNTITVQVG